MRRTLPLAVLALGALTGCTRVVEVQTTVPPVTTLGQPVSDYTVGDHIVATVYSLVDGPIYATDAEIVDIAIIMCTSLDTGSTMRDVMQAVGEGAGGSEATIDLFAAIAAVAVTDLCPQHGWMLDGAGV